VNRLALSLFLLLINLAVCQAQSSGSISLNLRKLAVPPNDADSNYIMRYARQNDVRFLYGGEGTSLGFGSRYEGNRISTSIYNNVNDLIGAGITYKIIDADISFSLPKTRLLEEDRENLTQFRLAMSYTGRTWAFRGYVTKSTGVISSDENGGTESQPDVKMIKVAGQITYNFNERRYSYRAANFQNELQKKTAGSFLIRLEPFYRHLEAPTGLVPDNRDLVTTYGDQAGLQYVRSPGLLLMPGYGVNVAILKGKIFISPIVLIGPGFAVNTYRSDTGKRTLLNYEWGSSAAINLGYNGVKMYGTLRATYDTYYTSLNPAYLTTTNLKISLTVGYRFNNLEKFIPTSFL
jgi:hypothetical protein